MAPVRARHGPPPEGFGPQRGVPPPAERRSALHGASGVFAHPHAVGDGSLAAVTGGGVQQGSVDGTGSQKENGKSGKTYAQ
jgi:hypothetical protein